MDYPGAAEASTVRRHRRRRRKSGRGQVGGRAGHIMLVGIGRRGGRPQPVLGHFLAKSEANVERAILVCAAL